MSPSKQQPNAVVGIALGLGDNNEMIVAGVKPGAPAHRSRMIAPGDQLVRIDGHPVCNGQQLKAVVQRLCGPVGSIVSLGVLKQSGDELDVVLVREQPSASLYSSHNNHAPVSPGGIRQMQTTLSTEAGAIRQMQSPVSPDAIPARDGVLHNLYSFTTSLPPEATGYDMYTSQGDTRVRNNPALSHISLSNVEAHPGVVYRAGPIASQRPALDDIDPHAPVVWPQGISQSVDQELFNFPAIPLLPQHLEQMLQHLQQSPLQQPMQSPMHRPMREPQQQPSVPQPEHMNQMLVQQMQQMSMHVPQNQQPSQRHSPLANIIMPASQHMSMMARQDMPQPEAISEIGMKGQRYNMLRASSPGNMRPSGHASPSIE